MSPVLSPTRLGTERLVLRPLRWTDVVFIVRLTGDPDVRRFLGGPQPLRARIVRAVQDVGAVRAWVVLCRHRAVGLIDLAPHRDGDAVELSYQFARAAWGAGYATEACTRVLDHAWRDLGLPRVIAETQTANSASLRLLERLGFREMRRLMRFGAEQAIFEKAAP